VVAAVLLVLLVGCADEPHVAPGTHIDRDGVDQVESLVDEILSIESCNYLSALNEDVLVPTDFVPEDEERISTAFDETSQRLRCRPTSQSTVESSEQDQQPGTAMTRLGAVEPERATSVEVFDGLSVELEVPPSVRSGDELMTTLHVENRSGGAVTDPGCQLSDTLHGLVPVDEPEAELSGGTIADCGGPFTYEAGAVEDSTGPTFWAVGKSGNPLPAGSYLAVMEVIGQRVAYPVEVKSP
jgi:hypothetical protein